MRSYCAQTFRPTVEQFKRQVSVYLGSKIKYSQLVRVAHNESGDFSKSFSLKFPYRYGVHDTCAYKPNGSTQKYGLASLKTTFDDNKSQLIPTAGKNIQAEREGYLYQKVGAYLYSNELRTLGVPYASVQLKI